MQEARPIVVLHLLQGRHQVVEGVSLGDVAAVVHAVEHAGEVIQGAFAGGEFADLSVHIQPDELAFRIEVPHPPPVLPFARRVVEDLGFVGSVLQRTPLAARAVVHVGGAGSEHVPVLLGGQHPAAGGEHVAQVFCESLVDPEQVPSHGRGIEIRGPEPRGAAELPVPGMHVLVGQEVRACQLRGRVREVIREGAVVAGLVVLQAEVPGVGGEGEQEVVMRVMMGAEQEIGLLHQVAQPRELLGADHEVLRRVARHVEMHRHRVAGREIQAAEITARDQG